MMFNRETFDYLFMIFYFFYKIHVIYIKSEVAQIGFKLYNLNEGSLGILESVWEISRVEKNSNFIR